MPPGRRISRGWGVDGRQIKLSAAEVADTYEAIVMAHILADLERFADTPGQFLKRQLTGLDKYSLRLE